MSIEQKIIAFTVQQINELLAELGKLPYVHSAHLIAGVKQIAEPQLADVVSEQQSDKETIVEPDISLS
jgi:hypothetical protein